ncbi:protein phosphatase 1 regulatory subunit 35-like, partial [Sphaeramia orbicularis]
VCFQPVVVTVTPQPHLTHPQQPIRSQRSSIVHLHGNHSGASTRWEEPPAPQPSDGPVGLAEAELHTTLALKVELQSLQGVEFNSQKAIQETLCRSTWTRSLINSRVTEGLNVGRSQLLFSSLVSVDVPADQLIDRALQDRLPLAPPPRCRSIRKPTDSPALFPNVSDLQRQKPLPPEEQGPARLRPLPFSSCSTFDLYSRQRRWEATP